MIEVRMDPVLKKRAANSVNTLCTYWIANSPDRYTPEEAVLEWFAPYDDFDEREEEKDNILAVALEVLAALPHESLVRRLNATLKQEN